MVVEMVRKPYSVLVARGLDQVPVEGLAMRVVAGQGKVAGVGPNQRAGLTARVMRIAAPRVVAGRRGHVYPDWAELDVVIAEQQVLIVGHGM
jgi:hypothetical protein